MDIGERSVMVDAYEKMRTAMLRSMEAEILMLQDARHALTEGHTEVTDEFLERVTDALTRNLTDLRGKYREAI